MTYSPKINELLIRRLYTLKHSSKKKITMTRMVNEALEKYLNDKENEDATSRKDKSR